MKRLLIAIVTCILVVWMGVKIQLNSAYLILSYPQWQASMPLWVAIGLLLIAILCLGLIYKVINYFCSLNQYYRHWRQNKKENKSYLQAIQGIIELLEGKLLKSEQNFVKAFNKTHPISLINYLGAATAAHQQKLYTKRDHYLYLARQTIPAAECAIGLFQVELQINQHDHHQALITLKTLFENYAFHPTVLKRLVEVNLTLTDWEALEKLLPLVKKYAVLEQNAYKILEQKVYEGLLRKASILSNEALIEAWKCLPGSLRKNCVNLQVVYIELLVYKENFLLAEKILKLALKRHWDERLINWYGLIPSASPTHQLEQAEAWLELYPNNPMVLRCLARLSKNNQLWGKARQYLEKSLASNPCQESFQELGNLLEQLGETELACKAYRQSLEYK